MSRLLFSVLKEILYLHYFGYHPTYKDVFFFLPQKINTNVLKKFLKEEKRLFREKNKRIYTVGGYSNCSVFHCKKLNKFFFKSKISSMRFRIFLFFIKICPFVIYAGLSGSLAYGVAKKEDDIDLFIITAKDRLWSARFVLNLLAVFLMLKRKKYVDKASGKVCMNLFFSENDLVVPLRKQTEYVAREIVRMKTLVDKDNAYQRFISKNTWILRFFPNFEQKFRAVKKIEGKIRKKRLGLFDFLEMCLRDLQLFIMKKNKISGEMILENQLWFFPDDFETRYKKLRDRAEKEARKVLANL